MSVDREWLAIIPGMLGSAHDGEIVNAARLAVHMLKVAGHPDRDYPDQYKHPIAREEQVEQALRWTAAMNDWEREFLTIIAGRASRLSPKQRVRLDEISNKIASIARAKKPHP